MPNRLSRLIAGLIAVTSCAFASPTGHQQPSARATPVSLAGEWRFGLDRQNAGIEFQWFSRRLSETVKLPGSTDENHKGFRNTDPPTFEYLSRLWRYKGAAWYQRDVDIPASWKGRRVVLFLERCHWETRVWLDGKECGMQDSLCVPHVHELGIDLKPGRHTLTLRVDNSIKYDVGVNAHSITEQTQTNWNGVVGRIELQAGPTVWIKNVQVYPDFEKRTAVVRATAVNSSTKSVPISADIAVGAKGETSKARLSLSSLQPGAETNLTANVRLPKDAKPWDEFNPSLCTAKVTLSAPSSTDTATQTFGLRKIGVKDKRLTINSRNLFLRGTLECCIFPLTGYPPTDVPSWTRILKIAKSFGLNHLRFHSWCPPEAAFEAADRLGFLYQIELPQWAYNVGQDPLRDRFIEAEQTRILDAYGNHPSFGMLCMGNELSGDTEFLQQLVKRGQNLDPRRLYTPSTAWSHGAADEYRVVVVRGLHGPSTDKDFREEIAKQPVPTVSHEVGQWCVFPNLAEIPKYTGVTRARNFETIRDDFAKKGLLGQAPAFTLASGKLSALLYKEEIEVLLRTPGHSGFQLLDLHDFPGQGTALVGVLDPFWDSKGLLTPAEHRRYCSPTVPLLRLPKRAYTSAETLIAEAEVSHFGPSDLKAQAQWKVADVRGKVVGFSSWPVRAIPTGGLSPLGRINLPLAKAEVPAKLTVTVSVGSFSNSWDVWVYPASTPPAPVKDLVTTRSLSEALKALSAGKKVLLFAPPAGLVGSLAGSFTPVFWSPVWFSGQGAATMGILCDPKHPALASFPTEFHTNWQWYDLLQRSRSMVLDGTPKAFRPIVQVVDNFTRNHKLGNLLEARVGPGKLMVCSINLWDDLAERPEARQLLSSLMNYLATDAFAPQDALTPEQLGSFLRENQPSAMQKLGAKVVFRDSEDATGGNLAANAIDGDPDTFWHTQWQPSPPPFPHEIQIDLGRSVKLTGLRYTPRQDMVNGRIGRYAVYLSDDRKTWGEPVAEGDFKAGAETQTITFAGPASGRFLRFVALSELGGNAFASLAELDVISKPPARN